MELITVTNNSGIDTVNAAENYGIREALLSICYSAEHYSSSFCHTDSMGVNWYDLREILNCFSIDVEDLESYLDITNGFVYPLDIENILRNIQNSYSTDGTPYSKLWNELAISHISPLLLKKKILPYDFVSRSLSLDKRSLSSHEQVNYKQGHVYAYTVDVAERTYFKIGKSKSKVAARGKLISSNLPFTGLTLFKSIHVCDYHNKESSLHSMFSDYRTNGEWFLLDERGAELLSSTMDEMAAPIVEIPACYERNFYLHDRANDALKASGMRSDEAQRVASYFYHRAT